MAGCGRAILEYDKAGELRFEIEDYYYLRLKLTDNRMLIESSRTSFELPLSPSEREKVMESIDRISKEIKETSDVIQIAKQLLGFLEEVFDMKQEELEKLIRDGAREFTQAVLNEGAEKIVEKVKADVKRCLAWYRIGENEKERIVNEYIERVRELVLDIFKEIKENERLYQKLVEHVEDGLWSRLLG